MDIKTIFALGSWDDSGIRIGTCGIFQNISDYLKILKLEGLIFDDIIFDFCN